MSSPGSIKKKHGPSINLENYTVLEKIGAGSYSTVYKGKQKNDDQIVAIKCVEKNKLSATGLENIITEIRLMKTLHHEHIIEMKDFQWDDIYIYIILEFCDGGDLSRFIKRRKRLAENVLKKFMRQLALGLRFLRSHDVSHLDLKPQNLLLKKTPSLILKIADFGFAQYLSDDTQHTSIRGSPLYMAPEMLLRNEYDAKADLWSVGIIAYECLFGKTPYGCETCRGVVTAAKAQTPIKIPEDFVSPECSDLLVQLLVYDPKARIEYCSFFEHPFLDLEHYPTEKTYKVAVDLVHEAVLLDSNKKYEEAFSIYCKALLYLVPYVKLLPEGEKKDKCRNKVSEYAKRAEEIKSVLYPQKKLFERNAALDDERSLISLCSSTPNMASALDIGFAGQMYLVEGEYEMALKKFKASLGILVPLLSSEPPGSRRDLLSKQIQKWLDQAESVRALLPENKVIQKSSDIDTSETCVVQ